MSDMPERVWLLADEDGDVVGYPYERPDLTEYVRADYIETLESEQQWQPIATAPKDGTWILVAGGKTDEDDYMKTGVLNSRPVVAFYNKRMIDDYLCEPDEVWAMCFWDGSWRTYYDKPTHWMPLPEPPQEAGE